MRIIRFLSHTETPVLAAVTNEGTIHELPFHDFQALMEAGEASGKELSDIVRKSINDENSIDGNMDDLKLLPPIAAEEVWAAGVTYLRSKEARNYEATAGKLDATTFYDKVYDAERPEIFFKSTKARTVGPGADVYIRSDSNWQIPEPELGLVLNKNGDIAGYTIGNDMSCRDIEGENPLYLPQAKIWKNSCSIGPAILLAESSIDPYNFDITCRISRNGEVVFEGTANTNMLKRSFEELVSYLAYDNVLFNGTVLLTGTCIVPPNDFTLQEGDGIEIEISGIGVLANKVKKQTKRLISSK